LVGIFLLDCLLACLLVWQKILSVTITIIIILFFYSSISITARPLLNNFPLVKINEPTATNRKGTEKGNSTKILFYYNSQYPNPLYTGSLTKEQKKK